MTRSEHIRALLEEYAAQRARNDAELNARVEAAERRDPEIARLRAERTGTIIQVAHLVALVLRKGNRFATWILFPSVVCRANQASLYP